MAIRPAILTYHDAIQFAISFCGGGTDLAGQNDIFGAVQAAYREVAYAREWQYLLDVERITTSAAYSTGTIAYDHTGGSSERLVTLTTGTWPSWAANGWIRISGVDYEVDQRLGDSTITLTSRANPGADVASSTTYTLFRDSYPLAADVCTVYEPTHEQYYGLNHISFPEWVTWRKQSNATSGVPYNFAIGRDRNYVGNIALFLWPYPSEAKTIDLPVKRRPRPIFCSGMDSSDYGTASTSSTTVTGSSTSFSSTRHLGGVIRFSADNTNYPTGFDGVYPSVEERTITAVGSTTSLTVDDTAATLSSVKFRISDRVDLHEFLWNYFFASIRVELAKRRRLEGLGALKSDQVLEQRRAMEADAMFRGPRQGVPLGGSSHHRQQVVITTA